MSKDSANDRDCETCEYKDRPEGRQPCVYCHGFNKWESDNEPVEIIERLSVPNAFLLGARK